MPNFKGGPKEAAKMLQALGVGASRKLLEEIRQKDPQMAELLENQLYSLEDLRALTPAMMRDFQKESAKMDMTEEMSKSPR